ncbi:hypothetical protein BH23PSE1_BH23PSE1_06660 [soil metagenome]
MPDLASDRKAFYHRVERRRTIARRLSRLRRKFAAPTKSHLAEVYDWGFRSDAEAVAFFYARYNDHLPDLDNPTWLNEKIRWQFIHHPNPLITLVADKIAVRDYIAFKGATIPAPDLYFTTDDPAALATTPLPERFVLKPSFTTARVHIEDGAKPTPPHELAATAAAWSEHEIWAETGELHYRGIPKRWLVEELLPATRRKLEYKVFCFMGEPKYLLAITERSAGTVKHVMLDCDWRRLPWKLDSSVQDDREVARPESLDLLLEEARRLSADFMHVRVDFLAFDDRLAFSELTFADSAAVTRYEPHALNVELGALMDLSRASEYLERGRAVVAAMTSPPKPRKPVTASPSARWLERRPDPG